MSYKRRKTFIVVFSIVIVILIVLSVLFSNALVNFSKIDPNWNSISFDVKLVRLNTDIKVSKNGDYIGNVKGNIFRIITDPLTFYNANGERVAYADDTYHLIAQDSHSIVVNNTITAEMVGLIKILGEAYDIYNTDRELIAYADFDMLNLSGKIIDSHNNILAIYKANPILRDFTIYISDDCTIDETTLIMIFASYYSDQEADSRNSSSNNNSD